MSFKITVSVFRTNTDAWFQTAEQTVWKSATGGAWSVADEKHVLTMGGSGNSGSLRFASDTGENFIAVFGVHNHKRWCDIVTNLASDETALVIHPQYYGNPERDAVREKQLACRTVNDAQGRTFVIDFTVADGRELKANLIIG